MKLWQRWCLLAIGIIVMAAGIVLVTKSATGNTPISATGYVMSIAYPSVTYGTWVLAWHALLIAAQIAILRSKFRLVALWQVPISLLFSTSIDVFNHAMTWFSPANYAISLLLLVAGMCVLAAGVACTVVANVAMNCGEALVCAITSKTGWNFGHTKVGFDLSCVAIACLASFATMGALVGVREGTFVCAAATGFVVNFFVKLMGGVQPAVPARKHKTSRFNASDLSQSSGESSDSAQNRAGWSAQ